MCLALANQGARVIAFGGFAADVSGLADFVEPPRPVPSRADTGRILRGDDLGRVVWRQCEASSRESLVDRGLEFARRRSAQGRFYFISNSSARRHHRLGPARHQGRPRDRARSDAGRQCMTRADPVDNRWRPRGPPRAAGRVNRSSWSTGATVAVTRRHRRRSPARRSPSTAPGMLHFVAGGPALPAAADDRPARRRGRHSGGDDREGVLRDGHVLDAFSAAERTCRSLASRSRAGPRQRAGSSQWTRPRDADWPALPARR